MVNTLQADTKSCTCHGRQLVLLDAAHDAVERTLPLVGIA